MTKRRPSAAGVVVPVRPVPPESLLEDSEGFRMLAPAVDVSRWVETYLLREGAPLFNPDHRHLFNADVAYLWAAVTNTRSMRRVVGQCEAVSFRCSGWQRARQEQQLHEWFGRVPEFLITLDAHYARECSDVQWCALIEHELYHIGHKLDEFGQPAFTKLGLPKLGIRGHDVEEFVGIVRRYGVGAAAGDTAKLVAASKHRAEIEAVAIEHACGTCMLRAA